MFEVYRPSGKFGALAIPLLIVACIAAVALGYLYHLALDWIPLIYFCVLATVGVGFAVGFLTTWIVRVGHVRSVVFTVGTALLLSLLVLGSKFWFQYSDFRQAVLASLDASIDAAAAKIPHLDREDARRQLLQQLNFVNHLKDRMEVGFTINRGGRNNGVPIKGVFVVLIWLIEAGIVLWFGVRNSYRSAWMPYSEKLNQWASEEEIVMNLPISDEAMVQQIRQANSVDDLLQIPIPKDDQGSSFASYRVNSIPGHENEDAYLSVDLSTPVTNSEGEVEIKSVPLVRHAVLTSAQRTQLRENASLLSEAIEEYRRAKAEGRLGADETDGAGQSPPEPSSPAT